VFQLNVCAEYLIEYSPGFLLRLRSIGFGLFDADDLTALGTFAEEMTGAIHFVLGAKPAHVGQFWFLYTPSFHLRNHLATPAEIRPIYYRICMVAATTQRNILIAT